MNIGVSLMLNPPYPVTSVGVAPFFTSPLACTRNMLIFVPSVDGYQTCSTSTLAGSTGTEGWAHSSGSTSGRGRATRKSDLG